MSLTQDKMLPCRSVSCCCYCVFDIQLYTFDVLFYVGLAVHKSEKMGSTFSRKSQRSLFRQFCQNTAVTFNWMSGLVRQVSCLLNPGVMTFRWKMYMWPGESCSLVQ